MKNSRILNGYLVIHMPEHPKSMKSKNWDGYVYEHIVIAEKELGRSLKEDEEVHHLDFNRINNSPNNLLVLLKISHGKLHMWIRNNNIKPLHKEIKRCKICDYPLRTFDQKYYCSSKCYYIDSKSNLKITLLQIISDFKELKSFVKVGKKYNLSDNGLRKWMKKEFNMSNDEMKKFIKKIKLNGDVS